MPTKYRWAAVALQMTCLSWHQHVFTLLSNQQTVTLGTYPRRTFNAIVKWCHLHWWQKHLVHLWKSTHSLTNMKLDAHLNCFKTLEMSLLLTFCRHLQRRILYPLITVGYLFLSLLFADYRYSNRPSRFSYTQRENPQETLEPPGVFSYSNCWCGW